jgi:3-ketosteroid 9alpha-monooxygenase subunit A
MSSVSGSPPKSASLRRYDLPLPFGWFAVAKSDELQVGQVTPLSYFASEFVVWRGEDGAVRALDSYCPHLGAHLGYGGIVVANDLRCPFHHWRFNGNGAVTEIPYAATIPPRLAQSCGNAWPVREALGFIFVWYHPSKAAPLWELATVPEIQDAGWEPFETSEWIIHVHMQEITENSADYAHFVTIHGTKSPPIPTYKIDGYARYSVVETKMATPRGDVDGKIEVRAFGPGQSFTRFYGITDVLMSQQATALNSEYTHLRQQFYRPPNMSDGGLRVARALARDLIKQVNQDIPIWEHKRFVAKPFLIKEDGPILAYRKNYARFYATEVPGLDGEQSE